MAIRSEELGGEGALIYAFPVREVRAQAAAMRRHERLERTILWTVALLAALGLLFGGGTGAATESDTRVPRHVVVRPGDTLWGIAERYAPDDLDPRAYVDLLQESNDLSGDLQPGQRIKLPK